MLLDAGGTVERQSSSGLIVTTGTGATGCAATTGAPAARTAGA
jgi:hypothetical protein